MPFCGVAGWSRSWFQHMWSPHRDLNSGPHSYQECALPLSYVGSALSGSNFVPVSCLVQGVGFEPTKHKAADLQSAGFDRSPIPAQPLILTQCIFQNYRVTSFITSGTRLTDGVMLGNLEPQGGFEPANLPITNRLRCHCATGAFDSERSERTLSSMLIRCACAFNDGDRLARRRYLN